MAACRKRQKDPNSYKKPRGRKAMQVHWGECPCCFSSASPSCWLSEPPGSPLLLTSAHVCVEEVELRHRQTPGTMPSVLSYGEPTRLTGR
ncbi:unnamed protein product [Boreogadus saida]